MNSRDNYKGTIIKMKKPTKKQMKLSGKIAYDKEISKVGQSVWKKRIVKENQYHDKIYLYVRMKCDKENCNGHIIIDSRNFKICSNCGLEIKNGKYEKEIVNQNRSTYHKTYLYGSSPTESIKYRNHKWDEMDFKEFIDDRKETDKFKYDELIFRYKNIKRWEDANRIQ